MSAVRLWWGRRSLRLRLTFITSALLCAALTIGALALTVVVSSSRVAALDEIAAARAATVARLAAEDRLPAVLPVAEPGEVAQVLDTSGRVIAASPNSSRTLPVLGSEAVARLVERPRTVRTAYDDVVRAAALATSWRGETATVVVTLPLREVEGVVRALRISLIGVVPTLTVLLGAAIWLALGRALRPVERLRRAAASVARDGGPGELPVPHSDDELGALARTLNEMLDRLDRASARQRAFVEDAAHELRSPIAALRASVEVARAHPDAWSSEELAANLEPEVRRMQDLVVDLLLLARVGAAPVRRMESDLTAVVVDALTGARTRPGISVQVRGGGRAVVDPGAVGRVVRNLVDNAVRHAHGRVCLTLTDTAITVEDDGAGVPLADRERVFERFVRLGEAREREEGGTGLGLAIAREIARDHGGDVVLEDSELGGLRATLSLPR